MALQALARRTLHASFCSSHQAHELLVALGARYGNWLHSVPHGPLMVIQPAGQLQLHTYCNYPAAQTPAKLVPGVAFKQQHFLLLVLYLLHRMSAHRLASTSSTGACSEVVIALGSNQVCMACARAIGSKVSAACTRRAACLCYFEAIQIAPCLLFWRHAYTIMK